MLLFVETKRYSGQSSSTGLCFNTEIRDDVTWELESASGSFVYAKSQWRTGGGTSLQSGNVAGIWNETY